jgi:hypothetical protein
MARHFLSLNFEGFMTLQRVRLRSTAILVLALLLMSPAIAQQAKSPPQQKAQQIQVPPPELLLLMIRTNIIAVDQANKTNNYTVLRALAGPGMQAMTPEQLSASFADMRNKQIDLAPTIVVSPQLTQNAVVSTDGILQLVGFFPTQPLQVHFQMALQPVQGFWRLAGLTINAKPPAQAAAPAKAPPAAKTKDKK